MRENEVNQVFSAEKNSNNVDIITIPEYAIPKHEMEVDRPIVKTASLDWLSINFVQPIGVEKGDTFNNEVVPKYFKKRETEIINGDFQIVPSDDYSRIFKTSFHIYYHGAKFGVLQCEPYQTFIKSPDSITVKVVNEWLTSEWLPVVEEFINTFNCKFHSISRADVALDGFNFLKPMQLSQRGLIRVKNRIKVVPYRMGNNPISGFYLGSRNSDRYIRGYHKNKEIEVSKKYYIRKFWQKNGVKESEFEKMERCEIVMKAKELRKFQPRGIDIHFLRKMATSDFLQILAKSSMDSLYHFTELKKNESQNVSRLLRVCDIIWTGTYKTIDRTIVRSAARIRSIQTAIKVNYQLYLKSKIDTFKIVAHELIHECELDQWFQKRKPKFIYEYELSQKKDRPFYPLYHAPVGKKLDIFNQPAFMRPFVGI